jgi:hypothetical protein
MPGVNGKGGKSRRVFLRLDTAKFRTAEFRNALVFHQAKIDVLVSGFLRD